MSSDRTGDRRVFDDSSIYGMRGRTGTKDSGDASADDGKRERVCEVDEM